MRARPAVLGPAAIALAAIGLGACVTTSSSTVSLREARAIVATYSRENNRANETLSVAQQNRDEQGPAAEIDDAGFVLDRRAGFLTVSGQRYQPFFEHLDESVAGVGSRYPRTLLTIDTPYTTSLKHGSRSCRFVGVFVKNSATSPWRVGHEPSANRFDLPRVVASPPAGAHAQLVVPLARLPQYYAIAFTTYFQEGVLSRGIPSSVFRTDVSCWSLPNLSRDPFLTAGSVSQTITATTVTDPHPDQISFPTADGGELSVFALHVEVSTSALGKASLAWRHRPRQPSSYLLPVSTGLKRVEIPLLFDLAVFDPPIGRQLAPRLIGGYWGPLDDASASARSVQSV
jgi:hypothetical protein